MASKKRWVIGAGVAVGIFLLFAAQNSQTPLGSTGTNSARSCTVRVTVDSLNVRSRPDSFASVVQTYSQGEVMSADRTIRNGFRQLGPDRWAARQYLDPMPGSDCG